jgi:CBS-domain-containing membrane protein
MLVRDIMTSPAVTIGPDDEVTEAARMLDRLSLTSLPVVDHGLGLLGIISEADVIARLARDLVRAFAHGDLDGQSADELSPGRC